MTVRVYRSDDSSAPTLNGTIGSLITVLDAILVNGYGAKTAAGWAKEFSGTNLAVYRAATGSRMRLRVDDTAAQEARLVGYETMSDVNTGTGPYPTSSQQSGGLFARKSDTANSTARPWICVATATAFYFLPFSGDTALATGSVAGCSGHVFFGDFTPYKPGDAYNSLIVAATVTGSSNGRLGTLISPNISSLTPTVGHYIPRAYTQAGTAISVTKVQLGGYTSVTTIGVSSSLQSYPDPVSGGIPLGPVEIVESATPAFAVRGRMPGLWGPLVTTPGAHLDIFAGSGELSGKSFTLCNSDSQGSAARLALETSDTW